MEMRIKIEKTGLSEPVFLDPFRLPFSVSFRVTIPEGSHAIFGTKYTLDNLKKIKDPDLIDDEDVGPGTQASSGGTFRDPIRAILLDVEDISGPIYLTVIQADNSR